MEKKIKTINPTKVEIPKNKMNEYLTSGVKATDSLIVNGLLKKLTDTKYREVRLNVETASYALKKALEELRKLKY